MELRRLLDLLEARALSRDPDLEQLVKFGAAADLMSDVLAYAGPGSVLLTGLINPQVVRTAEMAGIRAVVFVRGKQPPDETILLAEEIGISLLGTRCTLFEACGRLHGAGLPGVTLPTLDSWPDPVAE